MVTGKSRRRRLKLLKCCIDKMVVGTRTATCLPSQAARKAARMAISVLPNPTSPQTSRSIGVDFNMSSRTALLAAFWSGVSSYMKLASSACCK